MAKILILEDDKDLQEGLSFALGMEGYETVCFSSAAEAGKFMEQTSVDFLLLDCSLPDGNGFDFCRELRKYSQIPILMLTARDSEMDEIKALELGMDDYMRKPFSLAVLKTRIKKLLSRRETKNLLVSNGISIDRDRCTVKKDGKDLACSKIEYKLLLYFLENKNKVLSKEQILEHIWDCDGRFVDTNTVSVNINRLRAKIEENTAEPKYLKTVRGMGYLWKEGNDG